MKRVHGAMGPQTPQLELKGIPRPGPVVCPSHSPAEPDDATKTLMYLMFQPSEIVPVPELDGMRPKWLFGHSLGSRADSRASRSRASFATQYGDETALPSGELGSQRPW